MCIVNIIRYMVIEIISSRGSPRFGVCLAAICIYETERATNTVGQHICKEWFTCFDQERAALQTNWLITDQWYMKERKAPVTATVKVQGHKLRLE